MATEDSPSTSSDNSALFAAISRYDFSSDPDFQSGLSSILGHPDSAASSEELSQQSDLVLQAQCFYYARKQNLSSPVDWAAYKSHLAAHQALSSSSPNGLSEAKSEQTASTTDSTSPPAAAAAAATTPSAATASPPPPPPPYPLSFNHIIDLISRNEPIPGVEQIPDTVISADPSQSSAVPKRRKPWETDTEHGPGEGRDAGTGAMLGARQISGENTTG